MQFGSIDIRNFAFISQASLAKTTASNHFQFQKSEAWHKCSRRQHLRLLNKIVRASENTCASFQPSIGMFNKC